MFRHIPNSEPEINAAITAVYCVNKLTTRGVPVSTNIKIVKIRNGSSPDTVRTVRNMIAISAQ